MYFSKEYIIHLLWHRKHNSTQRALDAMITSLLRQNDVATSFWRNNDAFIAFFGYWAVSAVV